MQQLMQLMPGYRINEYLLVLGPQEDLWSRVMKVKEQFARDFQIPQAAWAKPQIALAKFSQLEMMEERIIQRLKIISMAHPPFKIELRDFGSLPSHTIFIQMVSREPVRKLVNEIKDAQRLMKLNDDNKPHFIDEPRFTIARKLLPWQYEKAWLEYSQRKFTGRFIAESMLLLKRRSGDKNYQILQRLEFMNLPVATRQGALFS
jgi:2'-5' RNA ligase